MTVVNPDSIAGITSVTSSGTTLEFYDVNGNLLDVSANLTGELTVGTGATISSPGASIIDFETNGSERLRIGSSGQIGIAGANYGTSGQVLTSAGSGSAVSWTTIPTQVTLNNNADNRVITGGSGVNLNGEANLTFDGTQLVVQGGSGTQHMFRHSAGWGGVTSAGSAGGSGAGFSLANNYNGTLETKWSIYLDGSNDGLRFTANTPDQTSDEKLRITSDGKVGIGTNVPDYGLHVYGAGDILIEDSGNGSAHLRLRSANGGSDVSNWKLKTSSNNYFYIENDTVGGAAQFTIDSSGDVDVRGNITSNNLPGNNILHNGEMAIWQRGTTSIYSCQNKYLVDRWKILSTGDGNGAIHQHTNVPTVAQTGGSKFPYSLRFNCTTADTSLSSNHYINLSQRIEGRDVRHLGFGEAGTRYATLSFWQRSNSGT